MSPNEEGKEAVAVEAKPKTKKTRKTKIKDEKPVNKNYYASDANINLIRACIERNAPALLIGETGTGKTTLIREVALEENKTLVRISVNGSMGVEEILGKWLVEKGTTKWQDGVLTDAVRKGHWVVMDEINAALPEILFTLHSLLDDDRSISLPEKDNEIIKPHKDFRFFATMNPPEEYAGTKDMNKALMSRFTAVLNIEVLDEVNEVKLLETKGADTNTAITLVRAARILRDHKRKDDIFYFCSTRDLVQCVELLSHGLKMQDAFLGSIVNKMSKEEYEGVKNNLESALRKKTEMPTKTLDELIEAVVGADKKLEDQKKFMKEQHEKEKLELRDKYKKEAADEVSNDFLEKLSELANKK
jgi:ATP-dependent Lon protease